MKIFSAQHLHPHALSGHSHYLYHVPSPPLSHHILFSFSLSSNRALLKEKLEYYERIAARYRGTQDQEERFALRMLRQERNRIEKQLYPNPLIRLLRTV